MHYFKFVRLLEKMSGFSLSVKGSNFLCSIVHCIQSRDCIKQICLVRLIILFSFLLSIKQMCSVRKLLYSLISIGFLFLIVLSEHDLVCTGKNNACAGELEDSEMQGSSPNMDFFNEGNMKWPSGDNNSPGGSPVQGRNSYISVDHHTWPSSNPILTHGKLDNFVCDPDSIMELTW